MGRLDSMAGQAPAPEQQPVTAEVKTGARGEVVAIVILVLVLFGVFIGVSAAGTSDGPAIVMLGGGVLGIVSYVTITRLFSIDRTMKEIRDLLKQRQ